MGDFPRTTVGGVSLSRLIIGTNWFLGYSHCTAAKDKHIKSTMDRKRIAGIIEVFLEAGVDTIMGLMTLPLLREAVEDAQDRTGKKLILISTPGFPVTPRTPQEGFDLDDVKTVLDEEAAAGSTFVMPHQSTTDALLDRCTRELRQMDILSKLIRERGMIPGLSTHMPEAIVFADESGLDVETYISLYNAMGFLMQIEVDWVASVIHAAEKPVMTIKPMASGQIRPFQALSFVWSTIRAHDMVAVGATTPDEAKELIEISQSVIDGEYRRMPLQETRSKASVKWKFE